MAFSSLPLVTIAIPTYNRAHLFLRETIARALGQTYRHIEVIVSDNCSTDNTPQVVGEFHDPRLRYVRQPVNLGANGNFNFCIRQARGRYFHLFLDDDVIDADFIESCVAAAAQRPDVGIIRTGTRVVDDAGGVIWERRNDAGDLSMTDFLLAWFSNRITMYVCSTLFNTQHLRAINGLGSRHNLFQDVMAEVELAARFGRADIPDIKAAFRIHDGNMGSAAKVKHWCEDSLDLLEVLCRHVPEADRSQVRRAGKRFLCRMNYRFARNIGFLPERLRVYFIVARMFDSAYPLPLYLYRAELRPRLRALKSALVPQ